MAAEELRKALCTKNVPAKVYVGMRYWHPFTEEAIEQGEPVLVFMKLCNNFIDQMFLHFKLGTANLVLEWKTTDGTNDALGTAALGHPSPLVSQISTNIWEDEYLVNMQHTVIPSWYQREGYIKAMADLIAKELGSFDCPDKIVGYFGFLSPIAVDDVMIFFSAHGVPLAYVEEAGDPYKAEMEECVDLIMEELEKRRITNAYTLAYQVMMPPLE
ncbi:hypothetical protein C3L33_18360, partial [Rhododendron williamsianum]